MIRRLVLVLLTAAASCSPAPAFAQQAVPLAHQDAEPPVARGQVALRVHNFTPCPMLIRVVQDTTELGLLPVKPDRTVWLHFKADTSAVVVDVVANARYCRSALQPSARVLEGP